MNRFLAPSIALALILSVLLEPAQAQGFSQPIPSHDGCLMFARQAIVPRAEFPQAMTHVPFRHMYLFLPHHWDAISEQLADEPIFKWLVALGFGGHSSEKGGIFYRFDDYPPFDRFSAREKMMAWDAAEKATGRGQMSIIVRMARLAKIYTFMEGTRDQVNRLVFKVNTLLPREYTPLPYSRVISMLARTYATGPNFSITWFGQMAPKLGPSKLAIAELMRATLEEWAPAMAQAVQKPLTQDENMAKQMRSNLHSDSAEDLLKKDAVLTALATQNPHSAMIWEILLTVRRLLSKWSRDREDGQENNSMDHRAIETALSVLKIDPLYELAYETLTTIYLRRKDYRHAEFYAWGQWELNPHNAYANGSLSNALQHRRKFDLAYYYLQRSYELDPSDPLTVRTFMLKNMDKKNYAGVIRIAEQYLSQADRSQAIAILTIYVHALALASLGNEPMSLPLASLAMTVADELVGYAPKDDRARLARAYALRATGRVSEAFAEAEEAIRLYPKYYDKAYEFIQELALEIKDYAGVESIALLRVERFPENRHVAASAAQTLLTIGHYLAANQLVEIKLRQWPYDQLLLDLYSHTLDKAGAPFSALMNALYAHRLAPHHPVLKRTLDDLKVLHPFIAATIDFAEPPEYSRRMATAG